MGLIPGPMQGTQEDPTCCGATKPECHNYGAWQNRDLTAETKVVKVAQSCPTLRPHGLNSPWNSPGQNTRVGSLSLLQEIFPTQGSNPGLPHYRQICYQLSHQGSTRILEWVAYPFSRGSSWPRNWTGSPALQADSLPAEPQGKPPKKKKNSLKKRLKNNLKARDLTFQCFVIGCFVIHMLRKFFSVGEEQPSDRDTIVLFGLDQCWRSLICISVHLAMSNVGSCFCSRGVSGMHIIFCKRHCHHEVMKHGTMPFLSPLPRVLLCGASGIASCSLIATVSVRHLPPSHAWNMTAIFVLVPLPLLFRFLCSLQKHTRDDCVTFPEDLRGFVNPPAPDGVCHSADCSHVSSPRFSLCFGSACAFVQLSQVTQDSIL